MKLLTEEEAAAVLQIKPHTLMKIRYASEGTDLPVPSLRIGGQIRYFEADLIEWARKQKRPYPTKKAQESHQNTPGEVEFVRIP